MTKATETTYAPSVCGDDVMKIVINRCYGGFSLSEEATRRYWKRKGVDPLYERPSQFGDTEFFRVPPDYYEEKQREWFAEDGNYKRINAQNWYLSCCDMDRDDPDLIAVIEEMRKERGPKPDGLYAELSIIEIPDGVEWQIKDYDGLEWIAEKHRKWP